MNKKQKNEGSELPESLTAKKEQFSEWYNQIIALAGLVDKRYNVKGTYVWLPYGFEIMSNIKRYWDVIFKEAGLQETYFPLLVPESYAAMNKPWFDGFKKEAFWVKGMDEKKATHILRPTGEPAMYPMFKLWTRTHADLPIRIYETVSSFRYETKHTRPIIRDREITIWFEIHTAHESQREAENEAKLHQKLYAMMWDKLALPYIRVHKPKWESFPGALGAIEDYTIMPGGKAMENGSINNLGQAYAKAFDIKFKDKEGKEKYAWQLCTGNGARYLAAVIAIHGDDKGLVIPPEIASQQGVIIPIFSKKEKAAVLKKAQQVMEVCKKENIHVTVDTREKSPGNKFYDWELKGVPLRIEIGPRDLKSKVVTVVRRDTGKKAQVKESQVVKEIKAMLKDIQKNMYKKAEKDFKNHIKFTKNLKDIVKLTEHDVVQCSWCGAESCYDKIKDLGEGIDPFGTDVKKKKEGNCVVCNKKTKDLLWIANTY